MNYNSFIKNTILNVLYRVSGIIFPFIMSIYTSRVLLSSGIGKVASIQNFSTYFIIAAPLGLLSYGTKEIAKQKNNKDAMSKVFSELFIINAISTIIFSIAYISFVVNVSEYRNNFILYLIAGIPIFFNLINIEWFYCGLEDFKYITYRSIAIKIISLILVFLFVRDSDDYLQYLLIYSISTVGNYVFNVAHLTKYGLKFIACPEIRKHLKPVIVLFVTTLAIELYTLLDVSMLNHWCNDDVVGNYTTASKLVKIIISLLAAVGGVLLPRLSALYKEKDISNCENLVNQVFRIMLWIALPCGAGIWIVAPYIIPLMYGTSFNGAIVLTRILVLLSFSLTFSNLFGTQILVTVNQEHKLFLATFFGMISNIVFNALLIPRYQGIGASIASVVSESLVTIITYVYANKFFRIHIISMHMMKSFVCTFCMCLIEYGCICLVQGQNQLIQSVVLVLVGVLSYLIISIILRIECVESVKKNF